MNILFVNQYFPPDSSATAYLLGDLVEDLAGTHAIQVIAGTPSYGPHPKLLRRWGRAVRVIRVGSTSLARRSIPARVANYGSYAMLALKEAIRARPRPDVVVSLTDPPISGMIGAIAARRFGVPFVFVCEDIHPDVAIRLGRLRNRSVVRLMEQANRFTRSQADAVIAIGRDMVNLLESKGVGSSRINLIPNWSPDLAESARGVPDVQLGGPNQFVVMHAGNQGLSQNLSIMLEAAERLADDTRFLFVLMGEGAATLSLKRQAKKRWLRNVLFLEMRPKSEAAAYMAAADVHLVSLVPGLAGLVVPSKVYGIMSLGRPFVAAVDSESEVDLLIRDHECGLRVSQNGAALAAACERLASDRSLVETMGRRGRGAYEGAYSRSIGTAAYAQLLERVTGASHQDDGS